MTDLLTRLKLAARNPSVLHLGCGRGHTTQLLHLQWPDAMIKCVESLEPLSEARKRLGDLAVTFEVMQAVDSFVADRMRVSSDTFDLIVCEAAAADTAKMMQTLLASTTPVGT